MSARNVFRRLHVALAFFVVFLPSNCQSVIPDLLAAAATTPCELTTLDGASLSDNWSYFVEEFQKPPQPVIIRNLTHSWPLMSWALETFFLKLGRVPVQVRPKTLHRLGVASAWQATTFGEYFRRNLTGVIFANEYSEAADTLKGAYQFPKLFDRAAHGKPIFSVGRAGHSIGFHSHEHNWLVQVRGRKVWFLAAPSNDNKRWHYHRGLNIEDPCKILLNDDPGIKVHSCMLSPSEVIYVPSNFFHATCNLDEFTFAFGWEGETLNWTAAMRSLAEEDINALKVALDDPGIDWVEDGVLGLAVRIGNMEMMKAILNHRNVGLRERDSTAFEASIYGRLEILKYLGEKDTLKHVDLAENIQDQDSKSMLHHAADMGHKEVVEYLVALGGKVTQKDKNEAIPLHAAVKSGHVPVASYLVKKKSKVEAVDKSGAQPMHYAALEGHVELVQLLLSKGAEVNANSRSGSRPLHMAALGQGAVTRFLLEQRADPNIPNLNDVQAIHIASRGGHLEVVEQLVVGKADLQAFDARGTRPVHLAVAGGHQTLLTKMRELGADMEMPDARNMRPLHVAAMMGHAAVTKQLLKLGALPSRGNIDGLLPADVAKESGFSSVLDVLAAHGGPSGQCSALSGSTCEATKEGYKAVEVAGILFPTFISPEGVLDLHQRGELQAGDVVVATYPRCGTTWMQQILLMLTAGAEAGIDAISKVRDPTSPALSPWIEQHFGSYATGAADRLRSFAPAWRWPDHPGRRILKTHAPVTAVPWVRKAAGAKLIVVGRNPKDAAVSNYFHTANVTIFNYKGRTWDDFLSELFLPGKLVGGDFWEWHAGWWREYRQLPKEIFWITFEELKKDLPSAVAQIAQFLGLGIEQEKEEQLVSAVAAASTYAEMKKVANDADIRNYLAGHPVKTEHLRRGEVGAWRDHFSATQSRELDVQHGLRSAELKLPPDLFNFGTVWPVPFM